MSPVPNTDPEAIAAIPDRADRLRAAIAAVAHAKAGRARAVAKRDMAAAVAHLDHGIAPVTVYRDTLGLSRSWFNRVLQETPAGRPRIGDPIVTAKAQHRKVVEWTEKVTALEQIQRQTILALLDGIADDGSRVDPWTNAAVARLAGLSSARIAQIRTAKR